MAENTSAVDALLALVQSQMLEMNTCLPGVVVSCANGRASVRPTGKKRFADGDTIDFPVIHDARVCWPSFAGGLAGVKGPILAGDRCLLVFSQQAADGTDDRRAFDLSDCYVIPCHLGDVGGGSDNASMSVFYGAASVSVTVSGQVVITAPGGAVINAPVTALNCALAQGAPMGGGAATSALIGPLNVTGDVTADGKSLSTHRHTETGTTTSTPVA